MANNTISPFFATPVMQIQLDLDLEKLTELAFQMQNKDKKGAPPFANRGGWTSNNIKEEKHEELIRLKKEITQHLQTYQSEVFQEMEFKGNVVHNIEGIWTNINEKYHYNDWHIHDFSTLSGVYYVKHDGSTENGDILFKHPLAEYMTTCHWPQNIVETFNMVTASCITVTPKSNMLLIFPSWLKHKVEANLKDDTRISSAFNSIPLVEKKS